MNASDLVENWLKEQGFKNERDNVQISGSEPVLLQGRQ